MSNDPSRRERDLILAPNEYAFILDETKGNVVNYVGPHKTSLANTDQPVTFNPKTKRFERCILEQATKTFAIAPEGWYLMLKNPAEDGKPPKIGAANSLPDLDIGRKVNIPGPVAFAPWPGQMIRVIQGHHLRSNQYLIVRVYDEEGARANWAKAVIKPQTALASDEASLPEPQLKPAEIPDLTMGKQLVIKGTDVSFYIPPTGVEVVADQNGQYVREAVTLERLEYCILLDEDGNKRYIRGPVVVFPKPTEAFVEKNNSRKFKAIELDENSGLYIKVIAPYQEGGQSYKVGDEIFVTGKEQMIYFPRPEHAIIRYGDQDVYYAAAIPAGEALYALDRLNGQITLKRGPLMFLPDPRKEAIVRRVLAPKQVELWFPGNKEALEYNRRLMAMTRERKGKEFASDDALDKEVLARSLTAKAMETVAPPEGFVGDEFTRAFSFPRTITLDTKYEGAVSINVWTGYAVLVVSKTGERKVVVGPQTYLLEYDETLETIELSTGTPKSDKNLLKTVYLRALHNKVSDIIEAETRDFCQVRIYVSYRMNFEGEPNNWFNVENYVKFLTDHMRSVLSHSVRQYGIEEFYTNAISLIRDTILGTTDTESGKRRGRTFVENGMYIYDVEVLEVTLEEKSIAELLIAAQHTAVEQVLDLATEKKNQDVAEQKEVIKQKIAEAQAETQQLLLKLQIEQVEKQLSLDLAKITSEVEAKKRRIEAKLAEQKPLDQINTAELGREKAKYDLEMEVAQRQMVHRLEELRAEVEAVVNKAGAVSPQLVAALQAFSDAALAEKMADSMAPLAILGGRSVAEVFAQLLKGTVLEHVLTQQAAKGK
jgi:major vault protein